jgi:tRNA A37 threonylcarbamoyladenosine modification protein TsaB
MFLLLDVASPIPEFHLINDKKIIDSIKIIDNNDQKLSDLLIPTYLEIDTAYKLSDNLKKLIITIGPGSYTALRVGASFIAGLSQSMNLPVSAVSILTIHNHLSEPRNHIGIYFESSNKQKFFSYKKNYQFIHEKIDNMSYVMPKSVFKVIYNLTLPDFINKNTQSEIFSIKNNVIENLDKLEFDKDLIIKPIYISNNTILN